VKKNRHVSIGNAFLWAAAILAAAIILRGTEYAGVIVCILGGAAGGSIILVDKVVRNS